MNDFSDSPGHQDTWSADPGGGLLSTIDQQGLGRSPLGMAYKAYQNREGLSEGYNAVKRDLDTQGLRRDLQAFDWDGAKGKLGDFKTKVMADEANYVKYARAGTKTLGIDPIQWLAGTIVSFLIETFQPLEDLIGLVTGNETRMQESALMWREVGNSMPPIADYMNTTVDGELAGWQGEDGEVARTRVIELGLMVDAMGYLAFGMQAVLNMMAGVARTLRELVEKLISKGVAWVIERIIPMIIGSAITFGSLVPLCVAMTIAQVMSLVLNAIQAINAAIQFVQSLGQTLDMVWDIFNVFVPFIERMINVPKA
jgi:hypothetical protein